MDFMLGTRIQKSNQGLTFLEIIVSMVVLSILSAFAVKPITGLVQKIKLQNSADGIKFLVLNARMRAVSNSLQHCGVVFNLHGSTTVDDTVFAFLDKNPSDYVYDATDDEVYGKPYIISKVFRISSSLVSPSPSTLVFRGDGSATATLKMVLTLNGFEDTLSVLASTGKVKVKVK
jgi:prepilin-type N-terminal cleavage/methylation domain-containing protein